MLSFRSRSFPEFNGLQVNGLSNELLNPMAPVLCRHPGGTVQEVLNNQEAGESTLVQISDATITGASTFNGSTTVSDATALWICLPVVPPVSPATPAAGAISLTAIVSQFNDPQLVIRNLDDVGGGGYGATLNDRAGGPSHL